MRVLGDFYLRAEWDRHRLVDDPLALQMFFHEWGEYLSSLNKGGLNAGQHLAQEVLDGLSEDQVAQLGELKESIRDVTAP